MSHADHEWAKEQIAAHLAGGLGAEERVRLEAHAASCAECIAEIDASRRFDRQMDELFLPVRARTGMEERIIQKLRFTPMKQPRSLAAKILFAAAAVFLMGVLGYVAIEVDQGNMPFEPGELFKQARVPAGEKSVRARSESEEIGGTDGVPMTVSPPRSRTLAPASGPLTGATWGDASDRAKDLPHLKLQTADELARRQLGELRDQAHVSGNVEAKPSFRSETLDDGVAHKRVDLGGGRGLVPATPPPAGASAAMDKPMGYGQSLQEGQKNGAYAYQNLGPASTPPPADPERFNPAEAKQLAKGDPARGEQLRKAEERAKDGKSNELEARLQGVDKVQQTAAGQGGQEDRRGALKEEPKPAERKVIRTGEVEYEIESFDSAVGTISKLVEEEAGYIATVNSDKLPNGKVRGVVVIRIPPEHLDTLLLKLRGLGELKSQNIRSQDVGKQYYDLESRLRAARTMEERLLKIIKDGKGEIKDLLLAEKELGEWRTKIETFEGEKRYYDNQISLSTLTVTLSEKEIRSASAVTETERVDMGMEVEDVDKAYKAALAAVAEVKGRVTKSDLKQLAAGQFSALINFEVTPDSSGPTRDRIRQLGNVARLDITRVQETEGGIRVLEAPKVRQKDTQFQVSIYNLANVTPRETVTLSLACADAEASYKQILARIEKAGGRMVTSSLNRQKNDQTTGTLRFEVKSAEADAVLLDIRTAGDVMRLDVLENPDTQAVTKSKKGFQVQLFAMGLVEPRETTTITIASKDVPAAYRALQDALAGVDARIQTAQLNENDRQNVNATLFFDYRRENDAKISAALAAAGDVLTRSSSRAQDIERVVDSKRRLNLTLVNTATITPRESYRIA
ncbi:MAG TPA: DUF4349 domain-containing protein, partial [Planctomycetota bacterium]|nr:DUF4349 domain-containing protein [Planctomycetota bacterium]